jgi:hypothetical protein
MGKKTGGTQTLAPAATDGSVARIVALAARVVKAGKVLASANEPTERIAPLRQIASALVDLQAAASDFPALVVETERAATASILRLEADLRDRCISQGWQIDGHWPSFWIQRGILVEIDDQGASATVSGKKVVASAESIVRELGPLVESLIPPRFLPDEFVASLAAAYDASRSASKQVPILDVYRAFVIGFQKPRFWRNAVDGDFVGFSLDQFRARLSACLERGRLTAPDRRELILSPPINPKDGLFVYQPNERRLAFVGHVEFIGD